MHYKSTLKLFFVSLFLLIGGFAFAQNTVSGMLSDADTNEPLIGANILVKGTVKGTISDFDGTFELTTSEALPYTLIISLIGFETKEVEITENNQKVEMALGTQAIIGNEVVVSASRVEEKILESPVTIEKLDIISIRGSASSDYYDEISKLKGVHSNQASMTFNTINTRGFASAGNTRFVQLMDGMDNSAPLLNFPSGNVVGMSELDINNVELVPGAASALYGPNAFNGILFMNSKSPFDYQGLSAQVKYGVTSSDAADSSDPYGLMSIRYAKAINNKFAFKINFSVLTATDWSANDYATDRNNSNRQAGDPNFDGLNTYGDETEIAVPLALLAGPLAAQLAPVFAQGNPDLIPGLTADLIQNIQKLDPIAFRRTGIKEEDLIDNNDAKSLKADLALHYRLTDKLELIYNYRFGRGSTIYQGSERYALRNFNQQFHKLELKGNDFFVRAYTSITDDGDSYNMTALGAFTNEAFSPTASQWALNYAGNYTASLMQLALSGIDPAAFTDAQKATAHEAGRAAADANRPAVGTDAFNRTVKAVREGLFQRGGAGFIDDSKLYHAEFNYDFSRLLNDVVGLQVGGNWRTYDLFTDGTVFNEDPEGTGNNERITIDEYGAYVQITKKLLDDRLKLGGSIRYDKNENFEGQVSPRISAVYSAGANKQHNFRASYQTGFRNPTTQAQFIYFPTTNILLGSTPANAERYGIHNGGAYSESSYNAFRASGGFIDANTGEVLAGNGDLLETIDFDFIAPEQLTSFELGYKGIIGKKLLVDLHGYYNIYNNFISQFNVIAKEASEHKGEQLDAGTVFRPYVNASEEITSPGAAIGITYKLPRKFELAGNYSWATFDSPDENFEAGFNTPEHRFNVSLTNRKIWKELGFGVSYKWQDAFFWESSFGSGDIDAFGVLDAQVSYKLADWKSIVKLGASNILKNEYRTHTGSPFIGRMIYVSITYDQFMQ